jgi:hypothetical protein
VEELVAVVLLVVIVIAVVGGVGLLTAMQVRNNPFLGALGLFAMMAAGVVAAFYSVVN